MPRISHAFTIDAEDWAELMCGYLGHEVPVSSQFETSINHLLDLLDSHNIHATFFVIARHAEKFPTVLNEIVSRGHELGSHGWQHHKISTFSPAQFSEDLNRSIGVLEELSGQKIYGYRAPFFSLMPRNPWALEAVAAAGLEYDSSITTLLWENAGYPLPRRPFIFTFPDGGKIIEFPALAKKVGPLTGRYIGGRGLRIFPRSFSREHLAERELQGLPAMLYLHTYEVAPDKLMDHVPASVDFISRLKLAISAKGFEVGRKRMNAVIEELLVAWKWAPAREVIQAFKAKGPLPEVDLPVPQNGAAAQ